MIAFDNKEASTVHKNIFEQWICKFGIPLEFISDNRKELCNNLAKEMYALLKIKHSTTTSNGHNAIFRQRWIINYP